MARGRFKSRFGDGADDFSSIGNSNPLDGVSNLVDVMLVFACGLLVALIINWNVDVSSQTVEQVEIGEQIETVEGLNDDTDSDSDGDQYSEFGRVYKNEKTGEYFVVSE